MTGLRAFDRVISKMFRVLGYAAGVVSCFMMLLSVVNVIARVVLNRPIYGTIELIGYSALLVGVLSCAQNEMDDGNPIMTLWVDNMSPKARALTGLFSNIVCLGFYAAVSYKFFCDIGVATETNQLTATLEMPMNIFYLAMFIGFVCLCLAMLLKAVRSTYFLIYKHSYNDSNPMNSVEEGKAT